MKTKQTSVDWLESEFIKLEQTIGVHGIMYELIEQAKAMEKEQIIDACSHGFFDGWDNPTYKEVQPYEGAEQYYNEQYGK